MSGVTTATTIAAAGVAATAAGTIYSMTSAPGSPNISIPKPPAATAAIQAAHPATMADSQVAGAGGGQKAGAAAAASANGTLATTPQGLTTAPLTAPATLLGGTK